MKLAVSTEQQSLIHGDARSVSIAAASIVAKVTRDRLMRDFDSVYPRYGLARNKGYSTVEHLAALQEFGPSPLHRFSFSPVREAICWGAAATQPPLPLGIGT
jgi:ribonuclease HII